jgi:hypothetical protein
MTPWPSTETIARTRALLALVRDELARLQDAAPVDLRGDVVNPITGSVYAQNTACACAVFASAFAETGEASWQTRARLASDRLAAINVTAGVDEPKWNRFGWHHNRGSLFTTGTLLDAAWQAGPLLHQRPVAEEDRRLVEYVMSCRLPDGTFAHDSVRPGHHPASVQNTTAIALFLLQSVFARASGPDQSLESACRVALKSLVVGQRADGFWPYVYPEPAQRFALKRPSVGAVLERIPVIRRYAVGTGDRAITFGDAVHHCLVLHYLAKTMALRPQREEAPIRAVAAGWQWAVGLLRPSDGGGLRFDFDWEPAPTGFRYANFRDTSTYFLLLATLPVVVGLRIVSPREAGRVADGLVRHVERYLVGGSEFPTVIAPYEGPRDVLRWMLPRVGEASAWKGALLAEFLQGADGGGVATNGGRG